MGKYIAVFKTSFIRSTAYKWEFFGSLFSRFIPLLSAIFVWLGVYNSGGSVINYSQNEIVTYLLLSALVSSLFSSEPAFRLGGLVRSGRLSTYLVRPISIIKENFAASLGKNVISFIVFLIISLMVIIFLNIGIMNFLISLILLTSSFIMYFFMLSCVSLLGFWLIQMWPLRVIYNAIYALLGGLLFPLAVFGQEVNSILRYNPFSLIGYSITETILGKVSVFEYSSYLIANLLWIFIFHAIYIIAWKKGTKKYEGMGA